MLKKPTVFRFPVPIYLALLIALQVVFSRFLSLQAGPLKFGFGFVPVMLSGALFGCAGGAIVGAFSDLAGALLFPSGAYFVGFTLSSAISGALYGFFYNSARPLRIALVYLACAALVTVFLNTFFLAFTLQAASELSLRALLTKFLLLLPKRALQAAVMLPAQIILTHLLLNTARLKQRLLAFLP